MLNIQKHAQLIQQAGEDFSKWVLLWTSKHAAGDVCSVMTSSWFKQEVYGTSKVYQWWKMGENYFCSCFATSLSGKWQKIGKNFENKTKILYCIIKSRHYFGEHSQDNYNATDT